MTAIHCAVCLSKGTTGVIDTRQQGLCVVRIRRCEACRSTLRTVEAPAITSYKNEKDVLEPFDFDKYLASIKEVMQESGVSETRIIEATTNALSRLIREHGNKTVDRMAVVEVTTQEISRINNPAGIRYLVDHFRVPPPEREGLEAVMDRLVIPQARGRERHF